MTGRVFVGRLRAYAVAVAVVAASTGAIALVRAQADVSNASMLYLLGVLGVAVWFGSGPAIVASVASFVAFNFFFVEPLYTFTVADRNEWVALGLLLFSGVVAGQLAATVRMRALEAERREKEAVALYDVFRLMARTDLQESVAAVAERLRTELDVDAVLVLFGGDAGVAVEAAAGEGGAIELGRRAGIPGRILGAGVGPTADSRGRPGRWIRLVPPAARPGVAGGTGRVRAVAVRVKDAAVGRLIVVQREGAGKVTEAEDRLLSAVSSQMGLALERLNLQREAADAEVLRRTDEMRSALLNAVSHDLRTPLASIIAASGSLMQADVRWTAQQRLEFARSITEEAERLNRLVGSLLDLSRIEAGAIQPEKAWHDLGSLIEEGVGRAERAYPECRFVVQPGDLPPVLLDYVEIDQVLWNLLENAAKHAEGEITVSACTDGDEVRVEVADRGAGIPEGALPHLFTAFYQARGAGGSGLGLAVAKGFVQGHGGRIWAENRESGGARFAFTLPRSLRPAAAA